MDNKQKLNELYKIIEEAEAYSRCIGKVSFDMECVAPEEGLENAGADMALLGKAVHKLTHSKRFQRLVCELHSDSDGLDCVQKKLIEHLYDEYLKNKNVTAKLSYEADLAYNKAYAKWIEAKKDSDFGEFRDSLADVVKYQRKLVSVRENRVGTLYDECLDDYEKGMTTEDLDAFFGALKKRIIPLMKKISDKGYVIRDDFMKRKCPIPVQEKLSEYLLEIEGLRKSALVLMTTEHPFTTNFGPCDVRVTTHYYEDNFISNVFSTLHEGGHALFMQNEPEEFYEKHAANAMSNAMHECISRFYENIIGRSEAFCRFIYPKLCEVGGDVMDGVSERELYEAVNASHPDLIRMEADELTYSLHIMIRYEIEKLLVNGEITVDEVPSLWNAKYKEYLGVDVPDDAVGCLQDVHWTSGFGYFPSYALGNAYGAQILRTMQKDFDVFGETERGNIKKITEWMKDNVFSCASVMDPDEWIRHITGESLDPDYFLDYLEEKYTEIYGL